MDQDHPREGSTASPASPDDDPRRPEHFFAESWRGQTLMCDAFGLPNGSGELTYDLRELEDGSSVIEHTVEFANGVKNSFQWAVMPSRGAEVAARDRLSGLMAKGCLTDNGFRWSFMCLHKTAFGVRRCRTEVEYIRRSATEAETAVTITFLGVTIGTAAGRLRCAVADVKAA
ncbi:MAG: hypothetical protein JSR45_11015 [Proteobacteria bacterium]|nr:hypothetical protein [Pseudomonadota bacterium]